MNLRRKLTWLTSLSLASLFTLAPTYGACQKDCKEDHGPTCADRPATHDDAVARIDELVLDRAGLESRAADALRQLDMQRAQILETTLAQWIDERLLEIEAERLGVSVEDWLQTEIDDKVEITDEQVDAWYQVNQARVRKPKEQVADQIKTFLTGQESQKIRQGLIAKLRAQHKVETLLAPFRVAFGELDGPSKGSAEAPIEVTVFSDFQCPYCRNIAPAMDQLMESYGEQTRLVFRQFPLTSIHPQAMKAAEFSVCAEKQERFWPFHDALFERFGELAVDQLMTRAEETGLDLDALNRCLDSGEARKTVDADMKIGRSAGVSGTPAIFVNGRPVVLQGRTPPLEQISTVVDDEIGRLGL